MNQFYTLSTDEFVPISYDNKRLFNIYELVNNFIRTRISATYKYILAKPILQNHEVGWYSPYEGLSKTEDIDARRKYFAFKDELQQHIDNLARSTDSNAHYWIGLLEKVFEQKNNILFSDGQHICVVWGWEFNNYQIQRPDVKDIDKQEEVTQESLSSVPPITGPFASMKEDPSQVPELSQEEPILPEEDKKDEEEEEDKEGEKPFKDPQEEFSEIPPILYIEEEEQEVFRPNNKSFWEFLKEFATDYWWLLVILLGAIGLVFFVKSLIY